MGKSHFRDGGPQQGPNNSTGLWFVLTSPVPTKSVSQRTFGGRGAFVRSLGRVFQQAVILGIDAVEAAARAPLDHSELEYFDAAACKPQNAPFLEAPKHISNP